MARICIFYGTITIFSNNFEKIYFLININFSFNILSVSNKLKNPDFKHERKLLLGPDISSHGPFLLQTEDYMKQLHAKAVTYWTGKPHAMV